MTELTVLLGKPGTGKGTHKDVFLETTTKKFKGFSVGDILREAIANNTPLGLKAASYIDAGNLVPDEIINGLVIEMIKNSEVSLISDGFPRTVGQAKAMLDAGIIPKVINLEVSDQIVIDRAAVRLVCTNNNCKETYTTNGFKPALVEGICDKCGSPLGRRKDDNPEVVKHRLEVYRTETHPVLKFLMQNGVTVHTIDSSDFESAKKQFAELMNR